jgi:hypothetical protein
MISSPSISAERLSDVPCRVLAMLYVRVGEQMLTNKVLCRGLLSDACAAFPTEVFVLSSVAREGLLIPLLASPMQANQQAALASRIRQRLGVRSDVAEWAAKAWVDALRRAESLPQAPLLGRTPPAGRHADSSCHRHTLESERAAAASSTDSLLRSVLRSFQPLVECVVLLEQADDRDLAAAIPLMCNALVGIARIPSFDSVDRWLGFCQSGIHFVGLGPISAGTSESFIRFTDLQTALAHSDSPWAVSIGDLVQVDLRGAALRSRDLTLLINALREIVAARCPAVLDS